MVIGSIVGAVVQSNSAKKAGKAQAAAADTASAVQRELGNRALDMQQPFLDRGNRFGRALEYELLGGEVPVFTPEPVERQDLAALDIVTVPGGPTFSGTGFGDNADPSQITGFDVDKFRVGDQEFLTRSAADQFVQNDLARRQAEQDAAVANEETFAYRGFKETPGYQFAFDEGMQALQRAAAAGGRLNSGATLKAANRYGQGIANQEYNTYLNRLAAGAGMGQSAASTSGSILQNQGNSLANIALQRGNAQASSFVGSGNAINQGIGGAVNSLGTAFGLGLF